MGVGSTLGDAAAFIEDVTTYVIFGRRYTMKGTVLYGPGDVRFEERSDPQIIEPTDAIIRITAASVDPNCHSRGTAGEVISWTQP